MRTAMPLNKLLLSLSALCVSALAVCHPEQASPADKTWLAGDHHIHSQYSVGWDKTKTPHEAIIGGDAVYAIPKNAEMAQKFGLSWMVATDHGGPNHSKINRELAYPELLESRKKVADVLQFYGLELNTPGGDHSSIIVPHSHNEADVIFELESRFDKKEVYPTDPSRDHEDKMIEALKAMREYENPPIVIAHHPSRSAKKYGEYRLYEPKEFRRWNDAAPNVAIGMEGAPGHQAFSLSNGRRAKDKDKRFRGNYRGFPTMGGFDQMTAKLGGFWDSMLGEGRRWWITANSDSHKHYTEGGVDFWPGEYSKTYVYANKNHQSVLSGLRSGQIFVTTGDLISELYVTASIDHQHASIGGEISANKGQVVKIKIKALDPKASNSGGYKPVVERIDLIMGEIGNKYTDTNQNENTTTRVIKRFDKQSWRVEGEYIVMEHAFTVSTSSYIRVRGTNTQELEPLKDINGDDPWADLWFYSNPIFIVSR